MSTRPEPKVPKPEVAKPETPKPEMPGASLLDRLLVGTDGISNASNIAGLGLLIWGVTSGAHPGLAGASLAVLLLLVLASGAWVAWIVFRSLGYRPGAFGALVVMGAAGGALASFSVVAVVFVGVAALGAAAGWEVRSAAWVVGTSWAALVGTTAVRGRPASVIIDGVAASVAGFAMGAARRHSIERAKQVALLDLEKARAEVEHTRAEVLAERNHLAREIHDVLAHTLSALSIKLEALDTLASQEDASPAVRAELEQTKLLVREGLNEARRAVRALREDPAQLLDLLAKLCRELGATLVVTGVQRQVAPDVSLALYRVAQEALTNAMKHAPGAKVEVEVSFTATAVSLSVQNATTAVEERPLSGTGAGYGLQGIRERVLLLGGHVDAGPAAGGWRVQAKVPA
ncbi:MAG TPA: histidine kinase [Acidimicrobiales bacterium]|nr:histidine kinase [Acidimicrobiales bacterium]